MSTSFGVARDRLGALVVDLVVAGGLVDAHGLANEAHGDRVAAGRDRYERIGRNDPVADVLESVRSAHADRRQRLLCEAIDRSRVRRPVRAHVRDLGHPLREPGMKLLPGPEAAAGERIALDVLDPALDLALGLRPVGLTHPRREAPVACEVLEDGMPEHAARLAAECHRARVVVEALERHAAEVTEGLLVTAQQRGEPLIAGRLHEQAPRVAEREHE